MASPSVIKGSAMAIKGFTRPEFEAALKRTLSPTTPIRSAEFLRGREQKLEDIRRSLVQPGRHIFIYGDRGVGKTSLAQTAAFEHHNANSEPVRISCDISSTFLSVAYAAARKILDQDPTISKTSTNRKAGASISIASAETVSVVERTQLEEPKTAAEALAQISFAVSHTSTRPIIVIDEFERVTDAKERGLFADFIKQVSDQSVAVTLIFCGVGKALDELLDAHHSCYRYLTAIELERLSSKPLYEIIGYAAHALNIGVETGSAYRIVEISDGFPHYVHLLTEKLFWNAFDDAEYVTRTTPAQYLASVKAAVIDIEPKLRSVYDRATQKYNGDYDPIIWAVADHYQLRRRSTDIFQSYRRLMHILGKDAFDRDKFNARMNALKRPTHGEILLGNRQGWYEFRETVIRGYVRLRAEERGVELGKDHPLEYRRPALPWDPIENPNRFRS